MAGENIALDDAKYNTAIDKIINVLQQLSADDIAQPVKLPKLPKHPKLQIIEQLIGVTIKKMEHLQNQDDVLKNMHQQYQSLIDKMETAFNDAESWPQLGSDVQSGIEGMLQASSVLEETMVRVSGTTNSSGDQLRSVVASTAEMTDTVSEIAKNAERAREVANEAVSSVKKAGEMVDSLGFAAKQINNVTETIVEIADQTKLLALNATIEAARAGEAGKGFAVVANEVKELAQQTNIATADIREKVAAIQEATGGTIKEIKGITAIISEVNDHVRSIATATEEQSVVTKEITTTIKGTSGQIAQANQNVGEATAFSQQMTSFLEDTKEIAQKATNAMESMSQASRSLQTEIVGFSSFFPVGTSEPIES